MSAPKEKLASAEWRRDVEAALDMLHDRNPRRREDAVHRLQELGSTPPDLFDVLANDRNPYVRQAAACALGCVAPAQRDEAIDALLGAVQDANDHVSAAAIEQLGHLRAADAVDDLCDLIGNGAPLRLEIEAVRALGRIGDRQAAPVLEKCLQARDRRLRSAAIRAIGNMQLVSCAGKVAELLADAADQDGEPDFDVCRACLRVLEQLDYKAAAPQLIRLAKDRVGVRRLAVRALSHLAPGPAAEALVEMLDDPNPELRASLVGLIEKANYRPATGRIRMLLHDSHVEVRKAALSAITAWGDTEMLETVRGMAFGDANSFLRPQAVESLVSLGGFAAAQADLARLLTDTNAKVRDIAERLLKKASSGEPPAAAPSPQTASPPPRTVETLRWVGDESGELHLLDQTRLPLECVEVVCRSAEDVARAIVQMQVRGAPAIGIAAAYGLYLGVRSAIDDEAVLFRRLEDSYRLLAGSRPTAVNLFWALDHQRRTAAKLRTARPPGSIAQALLAEAKKLHEQDRQTCREIGRRGAERLSDGQGVLTHCNAGGLATAEYGTALAVIFTAQDQGKRLQVFVDETRPLLQGARLTAWELMQRGVPCTLICDSMAAAVMRQGKVQAVLVGADRIAANGDTANKIGTYSLAVLAQAHAIPFYVAAPSNSFDMKLADGDAIPIEERSPEEITRSFGRQTAPPGVAVYNPAFDVTPARLIRAIITEKGVIEPVTREQIERHLMV